MDGTTKAIALILSVDALQWFPVCSSWKLHMPSVQPKIIFLPKAKLAWNSVNYMHCRNVSLYPSVYTASFVLHIMILKHSADII